MTEGVYGDIARWWFSNVGERYARKCRMHGSVGDSGMKVDSDCWRSLFVDMWLFSDTWWMCLSFSRMRSKGFRFTLGVWGLRVCSLDVAFASATVRARTIWPCLWEVLQRWSFLEVSDVSLLRFAWQAWHFVTFRRVLERVESRFVWQVQYFRDVFTRCLAFFVAGAALWTCPSSFFVAGAAL